MNGLWSSLGYRARFDSQEMGCHGEAENQDRLAMNNKCNFPQPYRCLQQCLSVVCLAAVLFLGLAGAHAQLTIPARSNTKLPALSMNGKIAFTSDRDGNREIYLMNSDGTNQVRLTNNPGIDDFPEWSPDGSRLAFLSQASGRDVIKLMNADGTGQTVLTPVIFFDLHQRPSWGNGLVAGRDQDVAFNNGARRYITIHI